MKERTLLDGFSRYGADIPKAYFSGTAAQLPAAKKAKVSGASVLPTQEQKGALLRSMAEKAVQEAKAPTKYPVETLVALLNMLIAADFLFQTNEFLQDTTAYKHRVKMLLKQLMPELEKIINEDLGLLIGTNENARVIFSLQDGFKNYIEQLQLNRFITHKPALIAGFGKLTEQFHQMPELVLHRNGIPIVDPQTVSK